MKNIGQGILLTASDIRKMKEELKKHHPSSPVNALCKVMVGWDSYPKRSLTRLILVAKSFSDEVIDLFEAGKINSTRLTKIAETEYPNQAYKEFLAKKVVEESLSNKDLDAIRELLRKGRHPVEAVEVVKGRRPENPITRNNALSLDRLVREWEKDGFSWRQRAQLIRAQGKIQMLQNGTLSSRIGYTLAAMKVAIDDMHRYVTEMWSEIPKEEQEAIRAEFQDIPVARKEEKPHEPMIVERVAELEGVQALPESAPPENDGAHPSELALEKTPDGEEASGIKHE